MASSPRLVLALLCVVITGYADRFALHPVADAALIEWLPTNNVGAGTRLRTGGQSEGRSRALVRFELGAITSTSKVVYARANFRIFYPPSDEGRLVGGIKLFRQLRAWTEGTGAGSLGAPTGDGASWQYADGPFAPWAGPGEQYASEWYYLDSGFASAPASQQGDLTSFVNQLVRDDVQRWVSTPATNHGWLIYNPAETSIACCRTGADGKPEQFLQFSAVEVASREDQEYQPELVIGTANPEAPFVLINDDYMDASEVEVDAPSVLRLETLFPDGRIFYTLDGSRPTLASMRYTSALTVTGGEVIRAISYNADYSAGGTESPLMKVRALPEFLLNYTSEGNGRIEVSDNGNIVVVYSSSGSYLIASNHVVTVTAVPVNGYSFTGWSGDVTNTEPKLTFRMERPISLTTSFVLNPPPGPTLAVRSVPPDFLVLQFAAKNGTVYRVQSSLDLVNWTGLDTYSNRVGTVDTVVSVPASSGRTFFRLQTDPAAVASPY